ncbi:hypothetical protein DCC81_23980 [Chitinophaga parva]|uniref:Uncharacterized protein n=1 Tax=Chitinophaga parva TaxID=2169414 RepID=A0A2T7BED1_9BACT|nr:hypothetical protein [Chitinophaga parva]PUZ23441.1 hypothetical protein DCC81_23980 [Chitinophaga parva]
MAEIFAINIQGIDMTFQKVTYLLDNSIRYHISFESEGELINVRVGQQNGDWVFIGGDIPSDATDRLNRIVDAINLNHRRENQGGFLG